MMQQGSPCLLVAALSPSVSSTVWLEKAARAASSAQSPDLAPSLHIPAGLGYFPFPHLPWQTQKGALQQKKLVQLEFLLCLSCTLNTAQIRHTPPDFRHYYHFNPADPSWGLGQKQTLTKISPVLKMLAQDYLATSCGEEHLLPSLCCFSKQLPQYPVCLKQTVF